MDSDTGAVTQNARISEKYNFGLSPWVSCVSEELTWVCASATGSGSYVAVEEYEGTEHV